MGYADAARLTPVVLSRTAATPSNLVAYDGTNGNKAVCPLGSILHFKLTGVQCVVTINTPGTVSGLAIADATITVPATTGDVYFPIVDSVFWQTGTQDVYWTYAATTGMTVEVLQPPAA